MNSNLLFLISGIMRKLGRSTDKAQGLVEYAIIILLVALAVFGGLTIFGQTLRNLYQQLADLIPSG